MQGKFITFEGTEGAGKSTLIRVLAHLLMEKGFEVCTTREPGGNPLAEKVRDIILHEPMDPWTELFLYEASRAEHVAKTIRPALAEKKIVLCDRFGDSSLAYQAHARGLPWDKVKAANRLATQGLTPDLSVFMDIDPQRGLERVKEVNRFEAEGVIFQKKVRAGFLKSIRENPKRWLRLPIKDQSPEELAARVLKEMERRWHG